MSYPRIAAGTDPLGTAFLARVVYGARLSAPIAVTAAGIAGTPLGVIASGLAGKRGGRCSEHHDYMRGIVLARWYWPSALAMLAAWRDLCGLL